MKSRRGATEQQLQASVERAQQRLKAQGDRPADRKTLNNAQQQLARFRKENR